MRRFTLLALAAAALALPALAGGSHGHDPRKMVFPNAPSGALILPVDLHTHSVFSDGSVWPDIRAGEAKRDGLAAFAVSEHIEYQPHKDDIPHPDRNRSYILAKEAAGEDVLVINGAEITRNMPPGHINAVFLTDVNKLRRRDVETAVASAVEQGGYLFWNHPYWSAQTPDGVVKLLPLHEKLIKSGALRGIEVANGQDVSKSALAIALAHDLAILGTSDVHGLVDWDYEPHKGGHRTVTLALAKEKTLDGIKAALIEKRTVAWFKDQLIGRPAELEEVVRAALSLKAGGLVEDSKLVKVTLTNASPVHFTLRVAAPTVFYNAADMIHVPPHGAVELHITGGVAEGTPVAFDILNAVTGPDQTLKLSFTPVAG